MMPAAMMGATSAGRLAGGSPEEAAVAGLGRMRTVTSVTTPSSPSDPTTTPSRS
jgi:hypothetical protein